LGLLLMARICKKRIILLLNWQPCFRQGCFFCGRKIRERKKHAKKKRKRILKKNLKKEQKKEKKEPAVYATAGSMLKKCFVKA
jgi:hypothetical protein